MGIALAIRGWDTAPWLDAFHQAAAGSHPIALWPDVPDTSTVSYLCCWKAPDAVFSALPNVRVIFSLGAGVDHLLSVPFLPDVPIVRVVDPDLTGRMCEYVTLHVLSHHRRMALYHSQQRQGMWHDHPQPAAPEVRVGIMGMGVLGQAAARALLPFGFQIAGWNRSAFQMQGVEMFHGDAELSAFLARSDILVVLLPLTSQTRGIISSSLLSRLPRDGALGGAVLINAGRGGLQNEGDILQALESGALIGASLDVFQQEPLPPDHPFWLHPRVVLTPHNAAASSPAFISRFVLEQIGRFEAGLPLDHVVDRKAEY